MAERKKAFKDMTIGEKIEQIWEYYKLVLLAIALGLALIIYIIYKILNPDPESILNVAMLNTLPVQTEGEGIFQIYMEENGYDTKTQTISINSNLSISADGAGMTDMASHQALIAMLMVGEIDILAGQEHILGTVANSGGLTRMEEILTPEQLEAYADRLYIAVDEESGEEYACGLKLPEGNLLTEEGYYSEEVWAAIPATSDKKELAKDVFLYLIGE